MCTQRTENAAGDKRTKKVSTQAKVSAKLCIEIEIELKTNGGRDETGTRRRSERKERQKGSEKEDNGGGKSHHARGTLTGLRSGGLEEDM